jgi:uncharacterized protein YhaN
VHVLTKIFIVLVTLLSMMLVPLVVVYAHNEDSYQTRYQRSESQTAVLRSAFEGAKASHGAELVRKDAKIQELDASNNELRRVVSQQEAEVRKLEARAAQAEEMDNEIRTQLTKLANAVDAGQQLSEVLIEDLAGLREDALTSERQKVELDEALRDALAKLDAATEARRALQEELQRLRDEHALLLEKVQAYVAKVGEIDTDTYLTERGGIFPDRDLDTTIIAVNRSSEQVLAEIDAGSRDGVREGWVMTIGNGATFVASLRITDVDINRAVGVVELEDQTTRGKVMVGNRVYARQRR